MRFGYEVPRSNRKRTAGRDLIWPLCAEPAFVQACIDFFESSGNLSQSARKRAQNRFIAERFLFYTGLVRTPQQISSHLQQRRAWYKKKFGSAWDDAILAAASENTSPSPSSSPASYPCLPASTLPPVSSLALPAIDYHPINLAPPTLLDGYCQPTAAPRSCAIDYRPGLPPVSHVGDGSEVFMAAGKTKPFFETSHISGPMFADCAWSLDVQQGSHAAHASLVNVSQSHLLPTYL